MLGLDHIVQRGESKKVRVEKQRRLESGHGERPFFLVIGGQDQRRRRQERQGRGARRRLFPGVGRIRERRYPDVLGPHVSESLAQEIHGSEPVDVLRDAAQPENPGFVAGCHSGNGRTTPRRRDSLAAETVVN